MRRILLSTTLALSVASAATTPAAATTGSRRVTTSAIGTARGVPDTATIVLGVATGGRTAQEALAANAVRTRRVIDGTRFVGVAPRDIRTSDVSLFPTFDTAGRIDGFSVSSQLTVTSHDVPRAGKVIDAATQLAGDDIRVNDVSLSIGDTGDLVRRARLRAVRSARTQAGQLARAAGARLGPVHRIVETRSMPTGGLSAPSETRFAADSALPIEPGRQELEIRVKVVYELR